MQNMGLMMFTILGMAAIGGLSMALYSAWPESTLERVSRHGRFGGLGTSERAVDTGAGSARVTHIDLLQGQSV